MYTSLYHPPLSELPHLFTHTLQKPFLRQFLTAVLEHTPHGGTACEVGCNSGYASIWLSQRSVRAEGLDADSTTIERTRQANDILNGQANFATGDPFQFFHDDAPRYDVVHHHGLLHRYAVPWIQALLAQQVASANKVVFAVPSVYSPQDPGQGERLLPLEEWQRILEPFQVLELRYCGDPRHDERDAILCVLQSQDADDELRALMTVAPEPYPQGISAIVHTRNEARHIADCLKTLEGWTDEIIVCDMERNDETVELARGFTDNIIQHPRLINFDRARNVSAMRAKYRWVFYLDADERVPPELGPQLRKIVTADNTDFEALATPFRTFFMGRCLQSLYPGYKAPPLYKNGQFFYNTNLHAGAQVDGRTMLFPANNPQNSILHHSFDGLDHYLEKLKGYSTAEAVNLDAAGAQFAWQNAVRDFVRDFALYYDHLGGGRDGGHGFIWSFLGGIYRFMQHAKLYEKHFREGRLQPAESQVPNSLEEVLEYALQVSRHKPPAALPPIRVQEDSATSQPGADVVWSGSFYSPSGYGEECRTFASALTEVGVSLAAHNLGATLEAKPDSSANYARLPELLAQPARPGFTHIINHLPDAFFRHPQAGVTIGRTMYETDRLPAEWVSSCNNLDYIWVPSEFNRRTFIQSGVEAHKLRVIPPCFDTNFWGSSSTSSQIAASTFSPEQPFRFLSVFDWRARKGWDVLLRAFLTGFRGQDNVQLIINAASSWNYDFETITEMAAKWAQEELGHDLKADNRVQFLSQRMTDLELRNLYHSAHAFVLPTRGEGWGRPFMEAMACGLPVIGTNWSGNTAFMNHQNSYLIDYDLVPVPPEVWNEMPHSRGHRWAQPRVSHLQELMRRVYEQREEAIATGQRAREYVLQEFDSHRVGALIRDELARIQTTPSGAQSATPPESEQEKLDSSPPISIRWEGSQFVWHSLAHVNRELCLNLLKQPDIELSLLPFETNQFSPATQSRFQPLAERQFAALSGPAAVHVRHFYPPRLNPPSQGHFVLMQPWEYGYLPKKWIEPIQQSVSEVWCNSRYERDVFVNSGISEAKIQLVPLGIETQIYNPEAPPYIFTTEAGAKQLGLTTASPETIQNEPSRPFTFLFVGGTIHRKGIDILLQAYLQAFTARDNVRLVIKDTGTQTVYRGNNQRERILALLQQEDRPSIVYLEEDLSPHQMAGLYTACDCLVQPYRGEGFCLPALEAMACGRAVLATAGGPTDDFVDDSVGWRIPAQKQLMDPMHTGAEEFVAPPWWFEVEPNALVELLRHAYQNQKEVKKRGAAGAERAASQWTWQRASEAVAKRVKSLSALPIPQPSLAPLHKVPGESKPQNTTTAPCRRAPTLSLCMIVRNEERVLGECLESAKPWFDEIILVDTGSTDRTVEIAQQHGAKVHHFPWCDDFSAARNESLRHATGEWIFWMDADDTLPSQCGRQLRELAFLADARTTGFIAQVHIPPPQGETGFTIVDHVKLFRNLPGLRFEGRIHEQILEPIHRLGGSVERSEAYVVHSGYDYSPQGQERKRQRDLTLLEKDLADRPDHPFVLFNIGMTAYHMKDFAQAERVLQRCLEKSRPRESTIRKVYAMLAGCRLESGDLDGARIWAEQGLALYPRDPELLFRSGIIYRELNQLDKAEACYLALLGAPEVGHIDSLDVTMTGYKAHHNLALIYQDKGDLTKSEHHFHKAINLNPNFAPTWLGLADIYHRTQRPTELRRVKDVLRKLSAPSHHMSQRKATTDNSSGPD